MRQKSLSPLWLIISLAVIMAACGLQRINTAEALAEALKAEGIEYLTLEPTKAPRMAYAKVDEAIAIKGENLSVEILKITDSRTYKLFLKAGVFLFAVEKKVEKDLPGMPATMLSKKPFILVVREEPEPGTVKEALNRIFPSKED